MRMTTRSRFAVVAMIDLALGPSGDPVSLSSIARRQDISLSYLEQLFAKLRRSGLVRSIRGPGGGYVLALPAQSITVADIAVAVDDGADTGENHRVSSSADDAYRCDTSGLWREVNAKMLELLAATSLRMLAAGQPIDAIRAESPSPYRGISSQPVIKPVSTNAPNSVFALGAGMAGHLSVPSRR
jgi:Rrf2 family iron-sulfur cluster assembly transcriptional regulator